MVSSFPDLGSPLKFEVTKFGNPTILWGDYRFIKKLTRRLKTWWELTVLETSKGSQALWDGSFRFSKCNVGKVTTRWQCTTKSRTKCKAYIKTTNDVPIFGKTKAGNPVITLGKYRFNRVYKYKGPKARWTCTRTPAGCRASVMTIDDIIIRCKEQVVFCKSRYGRPMLQYGQYRYNNRSNMKGPRCSWNCIKYQTGCRATILTYYGAGIRFELTRYGNPVMVLGKYRYNRWSYSKGHIVRWTCIKNQNGCRATVTTYDNVIIKTNMPKFTISRHGRPVMLLGSYRYNKWVGSKGRRVRWVCSQKTAGCKAKIYTFDDKPIFTTSNRGNPMIQMGRYNFSLTKTGGGPKRRWVCSKWGSTGCRATITTLDNVLVKSNLNHMHQ
ncbi:hypothetical protein RR48_05190 [Papilio machaon]|uniref:FLYWCH-type domain-containing protein n=1 Tax=Papilio machaon TaxID=76193 RepID=A0A0N1IFP5_PAPMA|nr:hypothetical protein RR48_05190 [Papilio machaon]